MSTTVSEVEIHDASSVPVLELLRELLGSAASWPAYAAAVPAVHQLRHVTTGGGARVQPRVTASPRGLHDNEPGALRYTRLFIVATSLPFTQRLMG